MTNPREVDYRSIQIDPDKDKKDYHWTERRADILDMILETGNPHLFTLRQLAARYDKSLETAHRDMKYVKEWLKRNTKRDYRAVGTALFTKAIKHQTVNKRYNEAIDNYVKMGRWLFDLGDLEKAPDKKEISGDFMSGMADVLDEIQKE